MKVRLAICVLGLCGCGGGGSDPAPAPQPMPTPPPPPPPPPVSADGIWAGDLGDGTAFTGVLHDGTFLGAVENELGLVQAFIEGTYSIDGSTITGSTTRYADVQIPISFTGTVVEEQSISLTFEVAGASSQVDFLISEDYVRPSSLDMLAGTWVETRLGISLASVAVNADGTFFGQTVIGCTYTGSASVINPDRNLYSIRFDVENCQQRDGQYSGYASLEEDNVGEALLVIASHEGMFVASLFNRQ